MNETNLKQRADLTFKHNIKAGRHGWLRLTPAYSVKVVDGILATMSDLGSILDPFSGTATTPLSAGMLGHSAVSVDINPFLVWFGNAKLASYSTADVKDAAKIAKTILDQKRFWSRTPPAAPPIHNIERWWHPKAIQFLSLLKHDIDAACSDKKSRAKDLLYVAFCRTLIALSNAAFNHQSVSFKDSQRHKLEFDADPHAIFLGDVAAVTRSAVIAPSRICKVILGDSRNLRSLLSERFDAIITSPPYANRMSYIRELRPYMYWLGYLSDARSAGELDWQAIGGTWGIATSRLTDWSPDASHHLLAKFERALLQIRSDENKNGDLLATYVQKYLYDVWLHLQNLPQILNRGARVHYIVGNSTFYGQLISIEKFYAAMLSEIGLKNVRCRPIRKRNSKKELIEFDVSAERG